MILTINVSEIFGPLLLVKRTRSCGSSGDKERFSGPGSKVQRDKRKLRGPPAGLG